MSGETTENHGMDGAEPGTGEHGDGGLRNHRHVNDDPVAFFDAPGPQCAGKPRDFIAKFVVGECLLGVGYR